MSRYLYKKIQNISPESLNFQHSGLKLTTLGSDSNEFDLQGYLTLGWSGYDKKSRNILLWLISYQNIPGFVYIFFIELSQ